MHRGTEDGVNRKNTGGMDELGLGVGGIERDCAMPGLRNERKWRCSGVEGSGVAALGPRRENALVGVGFLR